MQISIVDINEKKTTKRKSKIREFFEQIIDKTFNQLKEQLNVTDNELIEVLNEYLANHKIVLTLDEKETEQFQKISKRNYLKYIDTTTLLPNGKFTTMRNNPQHIATILKEKGIEPPIRVTIKTNRENKIEIVLYRPTQEVEVEA